ncbi:hypothetical protein EMPS_03212 [Entomortierella parvispora]|uniref:Uncharacterized protein n=1 Tax=Entomortierella parvispora TaxID=205924 RepID=A0A9P3H6Z0_9FUNG|nr:hypothetical protein EMPS_03212 [Entomortierella parvispora]
MAVEKKPLPHTELLHVARKHQKRVAALVARMQQSVPRARSSASIASILLTLDSGKDAKKEDNFEKPLAASTKSQAPKQILLVQDAIHFLITGLEKNLDDIENETSSEGNTNSSNVSPGTLSSLSSQDLARLKTCCQSLFSASYHCLYAAGMSSILSEESSWIGSSAHPMTNKTASSSIGITAMATGTRNSFMERDRANGRLYYEALYILKAGLDDLMAFAKSEPSAAKLYATFDQPFKDLKLETDPQLK